MKRILATAIAAMAFGLGSAMAQDKIVIGTEGAFPPWNGTSPNGELFGAEIDLIGALCEQMGASCEIVTNDFDSMIPALNAGKFDAIMAAMSITDERSQRINFSKPYFGDPARLAVLSGSPLEGLALAEKLNLDTPGAATEETVAALRDALAGKTIGAQISTTHANFIEQVLGDAVTLRTYQTQDDMNLDLEAGRIDGAVAENSVWTDFIKSGAGGNVALTGPLLSGGVFGEGIGVGLRKADEDLLARFNAAIYGLKADGTLREISVKWFGVDATL